MDRDRALRQAAGPFFTICIPVHNCERYILEAFESVSRQTCSSWEIVVVDDGSTDATPQVLDGQDVVPAEKLHIIRKEQGGQYYARWNAIDAARGQVIVCLDADDMLIDPCALEKLQRTFVEKGCDVVSYNACRNVDGSEPFMDYAPLLRKYGNGLSCEQLCFEFCLGDRFNQMPLRAIRRSAYLSAKRHSPSFITMAEDRLQLSEVYVHCKSMYILDECLYYYRPNDSSVSRSRLTLKKFQDQAYVEQFLDEAADAARVGARSRANAQLSMIVFSDLYWAFTTVLSREVRKGLYRDIRSDSFTIAAFGQGSLFALPTNRMVVLALFRVGAFAFVDAAFALFEGIKSIRDSIKGGL